MCSHAWELDPHLQTQTSTVSDASDLSSNIHGAKGQQEFHDFPSRVFLRVQFDFSMSSYNVHAVALLVDTVVLEVLPRMLLGLLADARVCE